MERSGEIWRDLERSGEIWRDLERSGEIWKDLERSGEIWRDLERSGEIWRDLERSAELASRGMSASGASVDPLFSSVISSRRRHLEAPGMREPRLNPPKDRFL